MATNNSNLKQFNVQHYAGPSSKLPAKLPFGDFYFAEDIEVLYKYNYQELPIPIGGGDAGDDVYPSLREAVPVSSSGVLGDKRGDIVFSENFLYYCVIDFVDIGTKCWQRIAKDATAW